MYLYVLIFFLPKKIDYFTEVPLNDVILLWIIPFVFVTIYWLSGAEYYYLIGKGDNGCDTSQIVVDDEGFLLYKNTKKEEEKNKLLGRYGKGMVLEIKKLS